MIHTKNKCAIKRYINKIIILFIDEMEKFIGDLLPNPLQVCWPNGHWQNSQCFCFQKFKSFIYWYSLLGTNSWEHFRGWFLVLYGSWACEKELLISLTLLALFCLNWNSLWTLYHVKWFELQSSHCIWTERSACSEGEGM